MTITELYKKLKDAYTLRNLNNISLTLINLYKNEQYSILQKIAEIISDFYDIEITDKGKGFPKLIKLYHPDRLNLYISELDKLMRKNDYDEMLNHSHILKLERIEEISNSLNSYEDIDYSPVYDWDFTEEGFSIINDMETAKKVNTKLEEYSFYDAVKIRQYGNTDMEFPSYYLEDIEDFELSSSNINDLDGVQFCLHVKNLDLSENIIDDITLLEGLGYLEELNLSDNQIEDIDILGNLVNLKRLYLSNNKIKDISVLLELDQLDYVELTGNKINSGQIEKLNEQGVTVEF